MQKLEITSMSVSEIETLLKSKIDSKLKLRLLSILSIAKGESSRKAEELLLLSHNQICIWVRRFNKFGLEGLKDRPKTGRKPKITQEQLDWLKNLVLTESPTNYGFNTETWTAPMLVKVVEQECNIVYSDDMIYVLLKKKLGLTHKKGKGFYAEAKPAVREKFVEDLKKLYECPKEDVFLFEDECSMSNTADVSYKWSEKGKQALIEQKQHKKERLTLFGAVNPISGEVIVQQAKKGNAVSFKKYLKKLIKHYSKTGGKIHMVLDGTKCSIFGTLRTTQLTKKLLI